MDLLVAQLALVSSEPEQLCRERTVLKNIRIRIAPRANLQILTDQKWSAKLLLKLTLLPQYQLRQEPHRGRKGLYAIFYKKIKWPWP